MILAPDLWCSVRDPKAKTHCNMIWIIHTRYHKFEKKKRIFLIDANLCVVAHTAHYFMVCEMEISLHFRIDLQWLLSLIQHICANNELF